MLRRWLVRAGILGLLGLGIGLWLTSTDRISEAELPAHQADAARGEQVFYAGGCASCHAAPGAEGTDKLILAGGLRLATGFGDFVVPNISPHPEAGIGGWSEAEFVTAMRHGVSPEGQHYFPAFPYPSYARMQDTEVLDLLAYLKTLPASDNVAPDHALKFPFGIRRSVGLWKLMFFDPGWVIDVGTDPQLLRGRELVEGAGHCAECHTPRNALGGPDRARWLQGGPDPEGKTRIPNITPSGEGLAGWSAEDIAYYLETGFTPDFDAAGGAMAAVIANTSHLPEGDRLAIAAYLKALPTP